MADFDRNRWPTCRGIRKLAVIADRYEFIKKLQDLKEIFVKKRKLSDAELSWIEVDGQKLIKVSQSETIQLEGKEFNGITFDIDALVQYLLLTCIDTILGQEPYLTFPGWLRKNNFVGDVNIDEISKLWESYCDDNGLRKLFLKGFNSLSDNLKKKFVSTFMLVKLDNGKLNPQSLQQWQELEEEAKFKKLSRFLYDNVRCKYTHESSRHFLPYKKIASRKATKKAVLVSCVNPTDENLINLLERTVINPVSI